MKLKYPSSFTWLELVIVFLLLTTLVGFEILTFLQTTLSIEGTYFVETGQKISIQNCSVSQISSKKYKVLYSGFIPVQDVYVEEIARPTVKVCGFPILATSHIGVAVTSFGDYAPLEKAGVLTGDIFVSINDVAISRVEDVAKAISRYNDEELELTMLRGTSLLSFKLTSENALLGVAYSEECYELGMVSYVYESTFCAIGHDFFTRAGGLYFMPIDSTCERTSVKVTSGSLSPVSSSKTTRADLTLATNAGLGGTVPSSWSLQGLPEFELGWSWEAHIGDALLYTTLSDEVICLPIQVSSLFTGAKAFAFEVTCANTEALQATNGFLSGMSGSVIVQDNRVIGVLSAMSASDSFTGYATSADRLYRDIILEVSDDSNVRG